MSIGDKLKSLRKQHRMTLEDVAGYIHVGRATILKYENGIITNIPSDKIEQLARLFNVSPSFLMGWSSEDSENDMLEALHQDPRLGLLFDRVRNMSDADKDKMLQIANVIRGEIYPDD